MRGAESDIPLTDRVSEVSLIRIALSLFECSASTDMVHNANQHMLAGEYSVPPSNCKGAACKILAEMTTVQLRKISIETAAASENSSANLQAGCSQPRVSSGAGSIKQASYKCQVAAWAITVVLYSQFLKMLLVQSVLYMYQCCWLGRHANSYYTVHFSQP